MLCPSALQTRGTRGHPLFRNQKIGCGLLPGDATYRDLAAMGSDPLVEKTFTSDPEELLRWANFFGARLSQKGIFGIIFADWK